MGSELGFPKPEEVSPKTRDRNEYRCMGVNFTDEKLYQLLERVRDDTLWDVVSKDGELLSISKHEGDVFGYYACAESEGKR